jgi:hypothetical protein
MAKKSVRGGVLRERTAKKFVRRGFLREKTGWKMGFLAWGCFVFCLYVVFCFDFFTSPRPLPKKEREEGSLPPPPPKEGVGFTGWNGCFLFVSCF